MNSTDLKMEVIEAINKMTFYSDRRDFNNLAECYDDTVYQFDSDGQPVSSLSREELIKGAKETLPGYDMLMHLLTNHHINLLSESEALITVNMYCIHAIDNEQMINCSWLTSYMHKNNGRWVIYGSHSEFIKQFGNPSIFEMAKEKVKLKNKKI